MVCTPRYSTNLSAYGVINATKLNVYYIEPLRVWVRGCGMVSSGSGYGAVTDFGTTVMNLILNKRWDIPGTAEQQSAC
jgi:hypothetical protein